MKEFIFEKVDQPDSRQNEFAMFIWRKSEDKDHWHCWAIKIHGDDWRVFNGRDLSKNGLSIDKLKVKGHCYEALTKEEVFAILL